MFWTGKPDDNKTAGAGATYRIFIATALMLLSTRLQLMFESIFGEQLQWIIVARQHCGSLVIAFQTERKYSGQIHFSRDD